MLIHLGWLDSGYTGGAEPASSRGLSHFAPQQLPVSECHVLAAFQDESPACACSSAQTHRLSLLWTNQQDLSFLLVHPLLPPAPVAPALACPHFSPCWLGHGCAPDTVLAIVVQPGEQHRHPQSVCRVWTPLSCLVLVANLPRGCTDSPWASGMLLPTGLEAKEDSGS